MVAPRSNASHDQNYEVTLMGVSTADGTTPVPIEVDPTTGQMQVSSTGGGVTGDGAILDGASALIKATVFDYTNSNPLAVVLRDTNGDYVSVGGGTQYDEDTVSTAADKLTMAGVVRKDTVATLVDTDGDRTQLQVDAAGRLWGSVKIDSALPAGTATIGKLATNDGIDIGDTTINNASGASAVNIQDGGNSITVDAPVGTPVFVRLSDGSSAIATLPVSIATNTPIGSVAHDAAAAAVNPLLVGGFASAAAPSAVSADGDAVQAWYLRNGAQATVLTVAGALIGGDAANGLDIDVTRMSALVAGAAIIGKVGIDQTTPGTTNLVALTAETTKVIGVIRNSDGAGNLLTSNSTTPSAKFSLDQNITSILGTAPTTVGKLDIKGADGDVFVRQATASNLNMTEASAASILTSVQLIDDIVYTDDTSTHATGTSKGALFMAAATPTDAAVNANDIGAVAMTLNRELLVQVNTALPVGTNSIGDIRSITTSIVPGTGATNLGKAEDAVHTTGDVGVAMLGVRDDTLGATSGAEGDYEMLHTTAEGALWVTQAPSITNGWSTFNATSGDGSTALTSTAQQVKATVGTVGGWYIYNPNATAMYVNFYNSTSAGVTVGTTNQQMVIVIPATSAANVEFGNGITFATAISISATTTGGGNTAPGTALEANIYYK